MRRLLLGGVVVNRSYRSIWSEVLGTWVAVSEVVKSRGKKSRSGVSRSSEGAVEPERVFKINARGIIDLSIAVSSCLAIPAYAQQFIVNDNGDQGCYRITDGGLVGQTGGTSACNTASTTAVMVNSGSLIVGGTNGTGAIGGLPTSTGGTTTAGGSTANTYGFYVLSNGAYINGGTTGTNIVGAL
ncbi:MAG: hypothetical protein IOB09_27730, partial [Burkholderia sp.]|nr:hypothetical protein [Burkholderia sp.]